MALGTLFVLIFTSFVGTIVYSDASRRSKKMPQPRKRLYVALNVVTVVFWGVAAWFHTGFYAIVFGVAGVLALLVSSHLEEMPSLPR
jgi:hypothetical protein